MVRAAMTRLLLPGVLLLSAACAHVKPECATHGGAPWRELSTRHFAVQTNLDEAAARDAVTWLERARAALVLALPGTPGAEARLDVIVFRSAAQRAAAWGDPATTDALGGDFRGSFLVAADPTSMFESTAEQQLLLHALGQHLLAHTLQRWPRWVGQGLVTGFETLVVDGAKQSARRGLAHQERLREVERWGLLPLSSLWAWDEEFGGNQALDEHRLASAWCWVHFLWNTRRPAMTRFLSALGEGTEPRAAFSKHLSDATPEELGRAAAAWLEQRDSRAQWVDLSKLNVTPEERPLPDAEVHALLARLAAAAGRWEQARTDADQAMSLDPASPRAVEQLVVTRPTAEARLAAARQVNDAQPKLASGWLLLGLSLPPGDAEKEKEKALELALNLEPGLFLAASELAAVRCAAGTCQDVVPLAERAAEQAPRDVRVLSTFATVAARAGLCAQALAAQAHALEVLPDRAPRARLEQLRARLAEVRRCGRGAVSPSGQE